VASAFRTEDPGEPFRKRALSLVIGCGAGWLEGCAPRVSGWSAVAVPGSLETQVGSRESVETLIEAGPRWGELVALKPSDLDFLRQSLFAEGCSSPTTLQARESLDSRA
jgi:hypothetical protein